MGNINKNMDDMDDKKQIINTYINDNLCSLLDSYDESDFDDILDERDEEYFSDVWMNNYNEVEKIAKEKSIDKSFSNMMREKSFKIILEKTQNSDLASYISDDFGLLCNAIDVKHNSGWLKALWCEYQNNKIPNGKLQSIKGNLIEPC